MPNTPAFPDFAKTFPDFVKRPFSCDVLGSAAIDLLDFGNNSVISDLPAFDFTEKFTAESLCIAGKLDSSAATQKSVVAFSSVVFDLLTTEAKRVRIQKAQNV